MCIYYETDKLLIFPLDTQIQILRPVEYLANTSGYWSRLSIKSMSFSEPYGPVAVESQYNISRMQ